MKKIVVLTGAGISAESGLKTFRDSDGLWESYNIIDVATPEAWRKNAALVQDFYNMRRKQVIEALPNKAHSLLVELEKYFDVQIVTQNIDDLHERAGSKKVLHLHGEIKKSRSTVDPTLIYNINGWELKIGEKCERGSQLRPHIVWFGEEVPLIESAALLCSKADVFLIVGTSLQVYPAAGLIDVVSQHVPVFCVDPQTVVVQTNHNVQFVKEKANIGLQHIMHNLIALSNEE